MWVPQAATKVVSSFLRALGWPLTSLPATDPVPIIQSVQPVVSVPLDPTTLLIVDMGNGNGLLANGPPAGFTWRVLNVTGVVTTAGTATAVGASAMTVGYYLPGEPTGCYQIVARGSFDPTNTNDGFGAEFDRILPPGAAGVYLVVTSASVGLAVSGSALVQLVKL